MTETHPQPTSPVGDSISEPTLDDVQRWLQRPAAERRAIVEMLIGHYGYGPSVNRAFREWASLREAS